MKEKGLDILLALKMDHGPRNEGGLWKLQRKKIDSVLDSPRNTALPMP